MRRRSPRRAARRAGLVIGLLLALLTGEAAAHDLRGTALFVDVGEQQVRLEAQIPIEQLGMALDRPLALLAAAVWSQEVDELSSYLYAHLQATASDGRPFTVIVESLALQRIDDGDMLVVQLNLQAPLGASARVFTLDYDAVVHRVVTHNIYVFLRHDLKSALLGDKPELAGFLHFQNKRVVIDRRDGTFWRGFASVFKLGGRHIAEGTDHLLFLLMLLLPAPLLGGAGRWQASGGTLRTTGSIVRIVSAFTVGHSLTLLLGAVGGAQLPERPVEILVAVSILVSAVHAVRPLFAGWEALVAGGFGLVHGLAFASALVRFGFDRSTLWLSVFGFNLGVEAMQLGLVALTMPWLLLLSRRPAYRYVRTGGALLGGAAACGWIGQRAFGLPLPALVAIAVTATLVLLLAAITLGKAPAALRSVNRT